MTNLLFSHPLLFLVSYVFLLWYNQWFMTQDELRKARESLRTRTVEAVKYK